MKNKILLISTIYPVPDKQNVGTKVCHFFAKEWMDAGYDVRVIHLQAVYPRPLYWIARLSRKKITAKTGAVVYTERDNKISQYEMDGVPVSRIPVFKSIPHGPFSKRVVNKTIREIVRINSGAGFAPDAVIGHFTNPVIEIVGRLKKQYGGARSCVVVHGDVAMTKKIYEDRLPELLKDIDVWGFRCEAVRRKWENKIAKLEKSFICYSGIPEQNITVRNTHSFPDKLERFIYVGEMIERKYPSVIIDALEAAYPDGNYKMTYVGDGKELEHIKAIIAKKQIGERVNMTGRLQRDEICKHYDAADCFVMISRGEAYGLVYLEAMARGCITIASRNQGFDGVIKDGINGFLCGSGDSEELARVIARINAMTPEERQEISENAIKTAKWLTDKNAAAMYINDVIEA